MPRTDKGKRRSSTQRTLSRSKAGEHVPVAILETFEKDEAEFLRTLDQLSMVYPGPPPVPQKAEPALPSIREGAPGKENAQTFTRQFRIEDQINALPHIQAQIVAAAASRNLNVLALYAQLNIQDARVKLSDAIRRNTEELTGLLRKHPHLIDVAMDAGLAELFRIAQAATKRKPAFEPSELWADRANKRGENPVAFIKRVYERLLPAKILTRQMLGELDKPLYDAYAAWIRPDRHPEDDLKLPTRSRTNLDKVDDPVGHMRAQGRERWRRHKDRQRPVKVVR